MCRLSDIIKNEAVDPIQERERDKKAPQIQSRS